MCNIKSSSILTIQGEAGSYSGGGWWVQPPFWEFFPRVFEKKISNPLKFPRQYKKKYFKPLLEKFLDRPWGRGCIRV